jgi:hypothetical protein
MDKTNTIRYIMTLVHFMEKNANIVNGYGYYDKVEERNAFLNENGIKRIETEPIYALHYYAYKGLEFHYSYYGSEYHLGGFFYFKNKAYGLWDIENKYDGLIADGYVPQEEYVRSEKAEEQISAIKDVYNNIKSIVNNIRGWGEIGGTMRAHGCHVSYDGGSIFNFSKDFVNFGAHTNEYPKSGWHLEKRVQVYFEDGSLSDNFAIEDDGNSRILDKHFEWLFGAEISGFGRFYTERELFEMGKLKYDYYRVRYRYPRELGTIETFDNYEDAKAFAYKEAKERAESVKDDRRRYAYTHPIDYADLTDTLCAYLYYKYDRGSEHIIFVQGEYR